MVNLPSCHLLVLACQSLLDNLGDCYPIDLTQRHPTRREKRVRSINASQQSRTGEWLSADLRSKALANLMLARNPTFSCNPYRQGGHKSRTAPGWRDKALWRRATPSASDSYPVLRRLAKASKWIGTMKYASGDSLAPAPFILNGTTRCVLDEGVCELTSSVVFPNGAERVVVMRGEIAGVGGTSFRLSGDGPIDVVISEHPPDTLLMKEIERASGRTIVSSSTSILTGDERLLQVAHELSPDGNVIGVQMWQMFPES